MTFTINERVGIAGHLTAAYAQIPTATIGHRVDGHAIDRAIRPVAPCPSVIAGPAVTVRTLGRDSTVCHKVIELMQVGDVVVVDRGGDAEYACWGEMMTIAAGLRHAAAVIVDGMVTDIAALRISGLPVFARGVSPLATQLLGEGGSINVPVDCGGLLVAPGDLVVADDDGVLVFSPSEATDILAEVQEEENDDREYRDELLRGALPSALAPIDELIATSNDRVAASSPADRG
ncbi:MAG: RraA family protein [Actinomycetota bacterium]|nr:RraA family protein [Actinomycetota bacterium]